MNQENHPKDVRTNSAGATYDIEKELSGAQNEGTYFDSENGRVSSDRGNKGDWEKIRGELLINDNTQTGDWFNMCSIPVNDDIFEIWVEKNGAGNPFIVINGQIMGQSDKMPWLYDFRIQFDTNESCVGGEVMLTDFNVPPIIFSIQDIKDNFANGTDKYFAGFNLNLYTVNLDAPLDIPVFKQLINLGGGGGLPVGSYQYSLQYVNDEGDATNHGPLTPPIPVVQVLSSNSYSYPYVMTHGGPSDVTAPTSYGVKLRFRVTNLNNYQYIQIRRISYNFSGGITIVPQGEIIAKIPIEPGEISYRDYVDPRDNNIEGTLLADNEEASELGAIEAAKCVRYYDKRVVLMHYRIASKTATVDVLPYNGKKIFPIMKNLGFAGHNDPVQHTYYKNYQSNEKHSFAINLFDGSGGRGFAVEDTDLNNFQFPSRRDPMDSDSVNFSYGSMPTAATVNSVVDNVFDSFSHDRAHSKAQRDPFKNILNRDYPFGYKTSVNVNQYSADAGYGAFVEASEIGHQPFHPVNQNDSDVTGHEYRVNMEVGDSTGDRAADYEPSGFGIDYYSKGAAIGGLDNFPSWAKSFSIVRSERAGRVICQGIGAYSLIEGNFQLVGNSSLVNKKPNGFWFHSPDIESGLINQSIIDDMSSNPQNYAIQLVSPLGFFSEVYGFDNNSIANDRDKIVDMITYARIVHDEGQFNPTEGAIGIPGPSGTRYVAYNKYRNNNNAGQGAFLTPDEGNTQFQLSTFGSVTMGRSTYYELTTVQNIYQHQNTGGVLERDFDDQGLKDFTEPMYIINIIRTGAEVQDLNINQYYSTGHYQKLQSIIGLGTAQPGQNYLLVDERWEDCIPALSPADFNANGESYIYLIDEQQNERVFLNVTYYSTALINSIITDINNNGFYLSPEGVEIRGIYKHIISPEGDINISFYYNGTVPALNERIVVKYDKRIPIKFFGGDTTVGENIFSPIDREYSADDNDQDKGFDFGIGFPYRKYTLNPREYITERTTGFVSNSIQATEDCSIGFIRQMCIMYCSESVIASHYAHTSDFPLSYFPVVDYIMRPNRFRDNEFGTGSPEDIADDNNLYGQYFTDYPQEWTLWKYGGFRFMPQYNIDYSVVGPIQFFSKPKVGFEEQTEFCTGVTWSLPRAINQQDSPGLKTFLSTNRFFVDDDNGGIVRAWDCRTDGKGDNLYAIAESGIVLLLTKKSILSNLNADDLSVLSVDSFIGDQYWISREIGSNDEMWRGMAEGSIELNTEAGKIEKEVIFIPNKHSIYRLMDNQIEDIAKDKYRVRIKSSLDSIASGFDTHITGHIDKNHNEYWLQIPDQMTENIQRCFVYDQNKGRFVGRFHYSFDSYCKSGNKNYGFRECQMFELDNGFEINGGTITGRLIQHTSINPANEKEFISIEINTGPRGTMKPTAVIIMDENQVELCRLDESTQGSNYLKQYNGWWNQIPRKDASVSANRDRVQYRLILFEINHTFEEDFKVVSSVIQYKPIK